MNLQRMSDPDDDDEYESLILDAALHVRQADDMRRLCNVKIDEAISDTKSGKSHAERSRCIVQDYSQNADVPQLGASQPGKTYYMSSLRAFLFGIVDCGIEGGALDVYVYHEGQGGKGGNNTTSMLFQFLKKKGWIQLDDNGVPIAGKELTIIMDNCGGQNKNNNMLRMSLLLVECGYFEKVTMLFYIVGHTKNCCDRWFSTMKLLYRKMDIWTFDMLCLYLKTHELIQINKFGDNWFEHFYDFFEFENRFYKPITAGMTRPGHIFTVENQRFTTMIIKEDDLGVKAPHVQEMSKGDYHERTMHLRSLHNLKVLDPPGVTEIKQVDLWKEWRKVVPPQYWQFICPKPSDDVMARVQAKGKAKRAADKVAKAGKAAPKPKKPSKPKKPVSKKKQKKRKANLVENALVEPPVAMESSEDIDAANLMQNI